MKRERNSISNGGSSSSAAAGKAKMQQQQPQVDGGMDELFAVLGYKVKSSEMADVAEKLEQLEMAMGTTAADDTSLLSTDTVHYNPSDLSGWIESMLSEFGTYQNLPSQIGDSSGANPTSFASDDDLRAIPGEAIFGNKHKDCGNDSESDNSNNNNKRMRSSEVASAAAAAAAARPLVLVDSQETGVRLVHTLLACAEAVQQGDMKLADALVKHVGVLAVSQAGAMRKVATCFAEGLARNIYKIFPQESVESSHSDLLQSHFYEAGPYMKFAHFTANQAILEAFQGESRVHVIDFSLKQGMQWPVLMQALALRPGGPPVFRLTGIGPPQHDNSDKLHEVGLKLGQLAETIGIQFEFRGFVVNSLADLDANLLDIRDAEAVAVNSVLEIHRVLARPGAIDRVLGSIRAMRPKIVTIVEQEANHNDDVFLTRFNEALHYYSTMFDSLESSQVSNGQDLVMTEVYLGRQICNVVACEGPERVERHETLVRWRQRMCSAGFDPVHLGSNAFKQASMLLELFGGADGYKVEESEGCLMLGWHTRPLIATSAWRLKAAGE